MIQKSGVDDKVGRNRLFKTEISNCSEAKQMDL